MVAFGTAARSAPDEPVPAAMMSLRLLRATVGIGCRCHGTNAGAEEASFAEDVSSSDRSSMSNVMASSVVVAPTVGLGPGEGPAMAGEEGRRDCKFDEAGGE